MRSILFLLVMSSPHVDASADSAEPARVEIKAPSAQQQRRQDNAGRIVVGRDDLTRFGDASVADALRRQPGISVVNDTIQLRGLGNGRTQILLNGEPAPPGFSPTNLAPALIERIEILRSASADASAQGIAGSINIVLRKPAAAAPAQLTLSAAHAGAFWSPDATLDLSRTSKLEDASMSSALTAQTAQARFGFHSAIDALGPGQQRRTLEAGRGATERVSLTPRLAWKFTDGATLAWQSLVDLSRNHNQLQSRETVVLGGASTYPNNGFDATARTLSARSDAHWNQRLGEAGRFEWKAGIAHNRRDSDYLFIGNNGAHVRQWQRQIDSGSIDNSASSSGKWRHATDSGHALAIGWDSTLSRRSEWRRQDDAAADGTPSGHLDQHYTASVRRLALFAQNEWSPVAGLDAYVGIRWEHLRTQTEGRDLASVANQSSVVSPVAHLLWQLAGSRDQVRLALSRTYKAPATRDLVPRRFTVNNDNGPTNAHFQGNPGLRPELAWGIDLAFESYFDRDGMLSASAYHRRITDVILPLLFSEGREWVATPRNAGLAVTSGIEFDVKSPLGQSGASVRATLSRNWSKVASVAGPDNHLDEQTPLTFNAGLDYRLHANASFGINWHLQAGSSSRTSDTQWSERGSVRRLDLQGRWRLGAGLALRLTATNLLAPDTHNALRYAAPNGADIWRKSATRSDRSIKLAAEIGL